MKQKKEARARAAGSDRGEAFRWLPWLNVGGTVFLHGESAVQEFYEVVDGKGINWTVYRNVDPPRAWIANAATLGPAGQSQCINYAIRAGKRITEVGAIYGHTDHPNAAVPMHLLTIIADMIEHELEPFYSVKIPRGAPAPLTAWEREAQAK